MSFKKIPHPLEGKIIISMPASNRMSDDLVYSIFHFSVSDVYDLLALSLVSVQWNRIALAFLASRLTNTRDTSRLLFLQRYYAEGNPSLAPLVTYLLRHTSQNFQIRNPLFPNKSSSLSFLSSLVSQHSIRICLSNAHVAQQLSCLHSLSLNFDDAERCVFNREQNQERINVQQNEERVSSSAERRDSMSVGRISDSMSVGSNNYLTFDEEQWEALDSNSKTSLNSKISKTSLNFSAPGPSPAQHLNCVQFQTYWASAPGRGTSLSLS